MSDATLVSQELEGIATQIDKMLTKLVGHEVAFSLFVWTEGRSNYISTANREEVTAILKQHIAGWEAGMPDIKAHEII